MVSFFMMYVWEIGWVSVACGIILCWLGRDRRERVRFSADDANLSSLNGVHGKDSVVTVRRSVYRERHRYGKQDVRRERNGRNSGRRAQDEGYDRCSR